MSNSSKEPQDDLSGDSVLQDWIADAIQFGKRQEEESQQHASSHRTKPFGSVPDAIQEVLGTVEDSDECEARKAAEHAKDCVEAELPGGDDMEGRQGEERLAPKGCPPDDVRHHGRKHHGAERIHREVLKDQLQREEDAGDRRVERRRDAGGRPAGDEQSQPTFGDMQHLADGGAERRPDLDNRPLAAHRATGADTYRRGERLDNGNLRTDLPAPLGHRKHDLRNAVAPCFRRKELDQRTVDEAAENRGEDDEIDAQPGQVGIDRMSGRAVVVVTGEQQREPANEVTKDHRA